MSREVCGTCWTPYDDSYKCACPTPALERMSCPRCGKVTRPDAVHTCTPKALRLADALSSNGEGCECHASSYYECGCDGAIWPEMYVLEAAAELRRLNGEVLVLQRKLSEMEQAEQKPFAWMSVGGSIWRNKGRDDDVPLYSRPPQKEKRRLTDEIIADLWYKNGTYHHHFARAIERYLKGEE